jgi:hypothetical protein
MMIALLSLAFADGEANNPIGVRLRPAAQDVYATFDAAHTSRRELDALLPLDDALGHARARALEKGHWIVSGSLRGSQAYGIGTVDAICDNSTLDTTFECRGQRTSRTVPVDAMASGLTVTAHNGTMGLTYSGSANQLQLEPRTAMRPVYPQIYTAAYGALTPLLIVADRAGVTETAGFPRAAHLLSGSFHHDNVELRLGTTLSFRPYAFVGHPGTGLRGEVLLRSDLSGFRSLRAGMEDHAWGEPDIGRSTALIRKLDLIDVRRLRNNTTLANLDALDALGLWWAQVEHDDVAGLFDVHTQVTLAPDVSLLEASASAHTKSWHRDDGAVGVLGMVGTVGLPRIPGYDAPRDRGLSLSAATRFPFGRPGFVGEIRAAWNDPELVTRLPYSASALHVAFSVRTP